MVIDCRSLSNSILDRLSERSGSPKMVVISIGITENDPGWVYMRNKRRMCEKCGIEFEHMVFSEEDDLGYDKIKDLIHSLNGDDKVTGIMVQSPVKNKSLDRDRVSFSDICDMIDPKKDVDGFGKNTQNVLYEGDERKYDSVLLPCTPFGCMEIIKSCNYNLCGKHAVVVGRSMIAGKPMAALLQNAGATVSVCHSKTNTQTMKKLIESCDVLVSAVGNTRIVNDVMKMIEYRDDPIDMIIDIGINRDDNNKLCGDIEEFTKEIRSKKYTGVPGGVGVMTTTMLCYNVWKAYDIQHKKG